MQRNRIESLDQRDSSRIPVYLTGALRMRVFAGGDVASIVFPVWVREVGPGGMSLVLDEKKMPRETLRSIVRTMDVRRGDAVTVKLKVGQLELRLRGVLSFRSFSGGGVLPVTWTLGVDVNPTDRTTRQVLANWSQIARDALHEACKQAARENWLDTRLLLADLGLPLLPKPVMRALMEEFLRRNDPAPWFSSEPALLPVELTRV
jgi:hypothetical protein